MHTLYVLFVHLYTMFLLRVSMYLTPSSKRTYIQVRNPLYVDKITSIDKMPSNTIINIYIAKRCFYIASLNNDMFLLLYRPSSVVHSLIFKANYTIYNVFVNEISCTSIKSASKITTVAVQLKIILT
jgi:hypothetical protein